jgi:endonuclease IV
MCEGLVDTEVEKFKTLAEGIEHADIDEYAEKLSIVKESYFTSDSINENVADDTVEGTPVVTETNSIMEGYANAITRTR